MVNVSQLNKIIVGGMVALMVTLIIGAFAVAGVINMLLAHVLILFAWLVGVLGIFTDILSSKPVKHRVVWCFLMGLVLFGLDHVVVGLKHVQESAPPEAVKVTATPTTEPPPSSPPLTVNMHTTPGVRVVVRRHDLSEKAGRENIRKQLSEFIAQGEELQSKLVAPQLSDTDADAAVGKWDKAVRQFLDEHMGTDYVTQFGSAEGITYGAPLATPNSKPKQELWRSIYTRNFRLKQFLQEVKD